MSFGVCVVEHIFERGRYKDEEQAGRKAFERLDFILVHRVEIDGLFVRLALGKASVVFYGRLLLEALYIGGIVCFHSVILDYVCEE